MIHVKKFKKFITHHFLKNAKNSILLRMVPSVGEGPGLVILRKQARAVSEIGFIAILLAFRRGLGYNQTFSGVNCAKT